MANKYDEKILSSFGKKTNDPIGNGVFVVDPNKVINNENNVIPRYVKQEDLVMYANLTARLNPDSAIIQDGNSSFRSVTIGQIGVNFMNPLKQASKNNDGTINFANKVNKGVFTTEWSDFFTTNDNQEGFFDPETFGITSIDVTHNAAHTPIIKIEFVDVQGRTLLERGNDPTNPYNIFYRFPYPLFTLTVKGYYGKAIEYPLSMTKTSTTFDSTSGNYIIRAEFLSRTFSIYNNFLMVYAYLAPFMYEIGEGSENYLGKQLLKALYQKQNRKYEKEYNVKATFDETTKTWNIVGNDQKSINEFQKHQFVKYPTIIDMIRTSSMLNKDELNYDNELNKINQNRNTAINIYAKLQEVFNSSVRNEIPDWQKKLKRDQRNTNNYYLNEQLIARLKNNNLPNLSSQTMVNEIGVNAINPYKLINDYGDNFKEQFATLTDTKYTTIENVEVDLLDNIINDIKLKLTRANGFHNETEYLAKINKNDTKTIFNDSLILFNDTSLRDDASLRKIYFSDRFFREIHKIIANNLVNFFEKAESVTEDQLFFDLKNKIGFVPNIDNVIRILMNNMQVFLTLLNLSALNSFRQIADDKDREKIQALFGEYEIDINTPEIKKFYPFPNYFQKELDINTDDFVFKKTYPGNKNTANWFEVQFIEEIFRSLERIKRKYEGKKKPQTDDDQSIIYRENLTRKTELKVSNKIYGLISSLLVINNLNQYDTQQTPIETVFEFVDKLMLFTGFGTTSTEKINTKLIDMLATHEFSMLEDSVRNADSASLDVFFNNIKNKITPINNTETPYDAFARTMAGNANNSTALVNNINNLIVEMTKLLDKQYTISELNQVKQKIEGYINSATNLETFKSLYDYDPLGYKNRKNPIEPKRLYSVFFNGLGEHSAFEANDPNMANLSREIISNYKEPTNNIDGYVSAPRYKIDLTKYPLDFKINNKVSTNNDNTNALAVSAKTEPINPTLKENKKIKDQTKYSKILI